MRRGIALFSPAKVNLFFRILKKRTDGYHEVASLMQAISIGDSLYIEQSEKDTFSCLGAPLFFDQNNLLYKALFLFREKTGLSFPVAIRLKKRIPIGSGLGGGSSNIATLFWGLNALASYAFSIRDLQRWAGEISSDAPFFFSLGTAYATGRNECIQDISPLPKKKLTIAKPVCSLLTEEVYRHVVLANCSSLFPHSLLHSYLSGKRVLVNDLEKAAFSLHPQLKATKKALCEFGFDEVLMTGSGSAFYCMGERKNLSYPGISFFPAAFLSRKEKEWYLPPIDSMTKTRSSDY